MAYFFSTIDESAELQPTQNFHSNTPVDNWSEKGLERFHTIHGFYVQPVIRSIYVPRFDRSFPDRGGMVVT